MEKKQKCSGNHEGHLCVLVSEGKFDEIRELVRKPKYICFNCGRVADAEKISATRCLLR